MQNSLQEFTIGFFDSSGVFSIYAKQYDTERLLKFHLDDEGQEYDELLRTANLTAWVREELPNGNSIPDIEIPSEYIDAEDSSITVPITADMVQQAGTAVCDLLFMERVSDDEFKLLSTTRFKLIIAAAPTAPTSGREKEWFDNWTELYISLKTLETHIETEEATRQDNEETRIDNENTRISNENLRISHENTRESNETTRQSNESTRQSNEIARETAETVRDTAETARDTAETARATAEDARDVAENIREENETARQTAETARANAEDARDEAEQAREAAEAIRESRVQEQVDEAHMWANGNTSSTAPEDTPSATNNSKYWCQQAHQIYESTFNGTVAEWNALSTEDKAKFVTVILLDD